MKVVNSDWAKPLGFSLKLKRPPKENKDNTKTLRLYCKQNNRMYTQEDIQQIEDESGLLEENCFFGLSFRFIPQSNSWVLCD